MRRKYLKFFGLVCFLFLFVLALSCCDNSNDKSLENFPIRQIEKPLFSQSFVYDGNPHTIEINENEDYFVVGTTTAVDAGSYFVELILKDKLNTVWDDGSTANVVITWAIEKATFDTTILNFNDRVVVADGKTHGIFVDEKLLPSGVSVKYSKNSFDLPGEYVIELSFDYDTNNYTNISPITAKLTILKCQMDVSKILFNNDFQYSLDESFLPIPHTFSIVAESLPFGVDYEILSDNITQCLPGEYVVEIAFYHNNPYYEDIPNMFIPFTIQKGDFDFDVKLVDKQVTFDFSNHSLDFNIKNLQDIEGISISFDNQFYSDAGEYLITATITNDNQIGYFNDFQVQASGKLVINKRVVALPIIQYEYYYKGTDLDFNVVNTKYYVVEENTNITAPGVYNFTIKLVDDKNTMWASNNVDNIYVECIVYDTLDSDSHMLNSFNNEKSPSLYHDSIYYIIPKYYNFR